MYLLRGSALVVLFSPHLAHHLQLDVVPVAARDVVLCLHVAFHHDVLRSLPPTFILLRIKEKPGKRLCHAFAVGGRNSTRCS